MPEVHLLIDVTCEAQGPHWHNNWFLWSFHERQRFTKSHELLLLHQRCLLSTAPNTPRETRTWLPNDLVLGDFVSLKHCLSTHLPWLSSLTGTSRIWLPFLSTGATKESTRFPSVTVTRPSLPSSHLPKKDVSTTALTTHIIFNITLG